MRQIWTTPLSVRLCCSRPSLSAPGAQGRGSVHQGLRCSCSRPTAEALPCSEHAYRVREQHAHCWGAGLPGPLGHTQPRGSAGTPAQLGTTERPGQPPGPAFTPLLRGLCLGGPCAVIQPPTSIPNPDTGHFWGSPQAGWVATTHGRVPPPGGPGQEKTWHWDTQPSSLVVARWGTGQGQL